MSKSGYTCVRYIFCWLNLILWITGCAVLGVGLWLRFAFEGYATLLPQYALLSADALAITVGTIAFVLSFCGCCGSWLESRWMLITYFSLVVFMFVGEFLVGSLAFVFRERLGHILREELQEEIRHRYNASMPGPNSLVTVWDHLQTEFQCCGVDNYEDWFMIDAWPEKSWVPDSCCLPVAYVNQTEQPCGQSENREDWYMKGCSDQVQMWFVQRLHIVGVVGLAVAFIQLFGLISSMLLFCTVKHKRTSYTYKSYEPNA